MLALTRLPWLVLVALFCVGFSACFPQPTPKFVYRTEVEGVTLSFYEITRPLPGRTYTTIEARFSGLGGEWTANTTYYTSLPWLGPSRWGRRVALREAPRERDEASRFMLYLDPARITPEQFEAWRVHLQDELTLIDAALEAEDQPHLLMGLHHFAWDHHPREYVCSERVAISLNPRGDVSVIITLDGGGSMDASLGEVSPEGDAIVVSDRNGEGEFPGEWPGILNRCRADGRTLGDDFEIRRVPGRVVPSPERHWVTGEVLPETPGATAP